MDLYQLVMLIYWTQTSNLKQKRTTLLDASNKVYIERECVENKISYASMSLHWLNVKMARDSVDTMT